MTHFNALPIMDQARRVTKSIRFTSPEGSNSKFQFVTIYALVDPDTKQVRYVGQTTYNIEERLSTHFTGGGSAAKNVWLAGLRARNLAPEVRILDIVPTGWLYNTQRSTIERMWVQRLLRNGHPLFNRQLAKAD